MSQTENNIVIEMVNNLQGTCASISQFAQLVQSKLTPEELAKLDPESREKVQKDMAEFHKQSASLGGLMDQLNKGMAGLNNIKL